MERLDKMVARYEARALTPLALVSRAYRYRYWTPRRHGRSDRYIQAYITRTLWAAHRIRAGSALGIPNLPDEMWELILSFIPAGWPMYHPVTAALEPSW